jgi:glycosyltransferase involved in cell wall biosynthesis
MRVTHISIIHKPLDTRIFGKQCSALAEAGYDVHLVAGAPEAGEVGGVHLHAIASDNARPPVRHQLGRFLRAARWAIRLRPSIYHLHDPHLIPLGLLLKLSGSRVVYDVHEDYPGHARCKHFARPLLGRLKALVWRALESVARRGLNGFVCASPALAAEFPDARTVVVGNLPRHREFARVAAELAPRPYRERPNALAFTGYLREIRCFWEIADALALLPDDLDCRLKAFGEFSPPDLEERARRHPGWSRIDWSRWQPHEMIVRELFRAKAGIVLLRPLPNFDDPIRSNKLFEFMAAGIPVIASDLPPWRDFVSGIGCGIVVDPSDPAAIAAAIEDLLGCPEEAEEMGKRGQAAVSADFNWDGEAPRLLSLYRALEGDLRPLPAPVQGRETLDPARSLEPRTALSIARRGPS